MNVTKYLLLNKNINKQLTNYIKAESNIFG